jgi:hypothetical protein
MCQKTIRVIEPFPFLCSEQLTELGIPKRNSLQTRYKNTDQAVHNKRSTHLISAQLLHDVHVLDAQLQPVHVLLQALLGILEIDVGPAADVPHASVGFRPHIGVRAAVFGKERFVRSLLSNRDERTYVL